MSNEKQKRINKNNRKRGSAFEKRVADFLGFEVVPYSGSNARFGYGDVRNDNWLIECKNIKPDGNKITLQRKWIEKNRERAYMYGKNSAIAWMPQGRADKFILLEKDDFEVLQYICSDITIELTPKVHNTTNLIIDIQSPYIKDIRKGLVIELRFKDEFYYMMSLERFKVIINE